MQITLNLDESLLNEALQLTNLNTQEELVNFALQELMLIVSKTVTKDSWPTPYIPVRYLLLRPNIIL